MMHPHVEIKKTVHKGRGVFATDTIKKGEIVWNDIGLTHEHYTKETLKKLPAHIARLAYFDGAYFTIDRDDPGNFMNHSCEPNSWWEANNLVANKDIHTGTEITYDYATTDIYGINGKKFLKCFCGSKHCRKIIRPTDLITDALLFRKYKDHLPNYTMQWVLSQKTNINTSNIL